MNKDVEGVDDLPVVFENPEWATFIPGRRPKKKTHMKRGHATNALGLHNVKRWNWDLHEYDIVRSWFDNGCRLYRFVDGQWQDVSEEFKP